MIEITKCREGMTIVNGLRRTELFDGLQSVLSDIANQHGDPMLSVVIQVCRDGPEIGDAIGSHDQADKG